jgi:hypothetical protein
MVPWSSLTFSLNGPAIYRKLDLLSETRAKPLGRLHAGSLTTIFPDDGYFLSALRAFLVPSNIIL